MTYRYNDLNYWLLPFTCRISHSSFQDFECRLIIVCHSLCQYEVPVLKLMVIVQAYMYMYM